ncbi:MAG: hypothetical protein LKE81_08095 [Acetobacter sp.]|jgi:hypothetical protein|nr:hypothetical protein [Acetobacter sp.]MCH4061361.1 hypothetical protein [Acetobacter sp.]MCH4088298.1 hypothetical protein [Acetobacter sp.]
MGLTEKTLELNVTHELLALGQGIWQVLWAAKPWSLTSASVIGPPIYAAGLSLQDELKHGWDVSLDLPSMGSTPARIAFLQFKLGSGRKYSQRSGSIFKSPSTPHTEHVLFGINNNSEKNQHSRLRGTGLASGVPESAIYALPLFTDEAQVRRSLGGLLANTVFFSVPDVDAATHHDPIIDGTKRDVAISKMNPTIREFRSKPVPFEAPEIGGQLIGEIAAVRLHRALSMMRHIPVRSPDRRRTVGRRVANETARFLSDFVGVDTSTAEQAFTRNMRQPRARFTTAPGDVASRDISQEMRDKRIFDVASAISPLLTRLDSGEWENEAAQVVETKLLATASPDGVRLNLAREERPASSMRLSYIVV